MQLDRRKLVAAGLGLAGAATAAATTANAQKQPATASGRPAGHPGEVAPVQGGDDTATLQAALDRAAAQRRPLTLAPGRYHVRGLRLPSGAHLAGGGGTVLVHLGGPPILRADAASDIILDGFSIEGGKPLDGDSRGLVELRGARALNVRNVTIRNSPAHGLVLERCSGIVSHNRIEGAARAGIFSLDADGGMEISHNHLSDLADNGILVWRSTIGEDCTTVAMNRIERTAARSGGTGENGNGINVFRAGSVLVTSNRISDCAFSAVRANSASNVQIVANSIARMGEVAVFVEFAFEGAVVSGNLIDGAATGISVTNFDHGGRLAVVQGNLVRNLQFHRGPSDPGGYGIAVEADASVTGNTIEGAPTAGLAIGWGRFCRDIAATGNVIRACTLGISVTATAEAGTVLLAGNLIAGSRQGAIRTTDHGRIVGPDLALSPPAGGRVRASGNVVA